MANHADLTDPELHEPKGAAAATAGQIYVANGAGGGSFTKQTEKITAAITPASVSANSTSEQSFTFTGVGAGDSCVGISKPSYQAGLGIVNWRVASANTIAITYMNNSGGNITPSAETYTAIVFR